MTQSADIISREKERCAYNYAPLPVVLSKGQGVWLWDVEGTQYLDMMSAYSAVSHGHHHPKLIAALKEQVDTLAVTSRAFYSNKLYSFMELICELAQLDMALPMNTGAEAVETAIKAARRWGYRHKNIPKDQAEIIVAENNFHGRTLTITSFSTDEAYKKDYGPFTPGFKAIPFGDADALRKTITSNTCAFLVEPMQGEAGIVLPPKGWLKEVEGICKENNVLLIIDEIQTGLGRTGKLFAFEHENVKPDGLILGKALGGGILPVSAFIANQEVMSVFEPGSHGSTFGGNPLACHVAQTALEVIQEENLTKNSQELGEFLMESLRDLELPFIKEIRGKGLWIGLDIKTSQPSAHDLCLAMLKHGILTKEVHDTVIRLAPPLIITREECELALDRIHKAFLSLV